MYRNDRVATALQLTSHPLPQRSAAMIGLLARCRARIAAGFVGVLGAAATCVAALASAFGEVNNGLVALVFVGIWPVVALTWLVSFVLTHDLQIGLPKVSRSLGEIDARREVARRMNDTDGARLKALAVDLEKWSIVWPSWAVILLAPLTLHTLMFFVPDLLDASSWSAVYPLTPFAGLGWWIMVSIGITWLPHLVLCGLALRFCHQLRDESAPRKAVWVIASGHLMLTAMSVVPSALFFAVIAGGHHAPVGGIFGTIAVFAGAIIFITGLAFLPLTYGWARKRYLADQGILQP